MTIRIHAKDNVDTIFCYDNVQCFYHDYGAFHIVFKSGIVRVYPDRHIWYIERDL